MEVKESTSPVTLLGDVVGSRRAPDRRRLHEHLTRTLQVIDRWCPSIGGLTVTVGDEFQGVYAHLGEALAVTLRLRTLLLPEVDVRVGLGRGDLVALDEHGRQDGPGWWAARQALEEVERAAARPSSQSRRTGFRQACSLADAGGARSVTAHDVAVTDAAATANFTSAAELEWAVGAALLVQDQLVGALSPRALAVLDALVTGEHTRAHIAKAQGVSPSAVSQLVKRHGLELLVQAHQQLRRLA